MPDAPLERVGARSTPCALGPPSRTWVGDGPVPSLAKRHRKRLATGRVLAPLIPELWSGPWATPTITLHW